MKNQTAKNQTAKTQTAKTQTNVQETQKAATGTTIVTNWTGTVAPSDINFLRQVGGDIRDWR
ncbi:MAG: hypothetical protein Q8T09_02715 [Candidatus Melainabacteria bacterium]|nr:hypothetical protein [Candidatus Melainabacteria bacterium]